MVGSKQIFMKLHLIRHAKTAPTEFSVKDFERSLLTKGIIQSNVLAYYLSEHSISSKFTWCSDAIRTRETLSILKQVNDLGKIVYSPELYLCDRDIYLELIWKQKGDKDLLFIGHNDGISDLVNYFSGQNIVLKTSEFVSIEFSFDTWKEVSFDTGIITSRFRPEVYFPDL